MGKKPKKDPNAPTQIPEDVFQRLRKLAELKSAPKAPKPGSDLTSEEFCIQPAFLNLPEMKTSVHYYQKMAIVHYTEREMKVPSQMKIVEDIDESLCKAHPRKEIQDLMKYAKGQVKQATKRTGQFLKQLTKKETKELKRTNLVKQIQDVDSAMNEELMNSRKFAERQALFDKRYMIGSKLGDTAPRKNALILIECSDKQQQWINEVKDEITKFLNGVILEGECESLNLATFSQGSVTSWMPQFQPKADPKKGLADALKWLTKMFSPKTCGPQSFPPDWQEALKKFTAEGSQPPWHVYICCSRTPEGSTEEVKALVKDLRQNLGEPAKGQPPLPISIVAFDPTIVGDETEKVFFEEVAGDKGSFMIDTSADDLVALEKMLKAVQVKKKQFDKLNKKLDKMADLSELVAEDRSLFQMQAALMNMLESDYLVFDWALKNEKQAPPPDI